MENEVVCEAVEENKESFSENSPYKSLASFADNFFLRTEDVLNIYMAGNSFAKAGKKLDVEKEHYKGKKSLFHSLRILMFGIQIAKEGRITNYGEANDLWKEIKEVPSNDWKEFYGRYKHLWNKLKSEFRQVAPLGRNRLSAFKKDNSKQIKDSNDDENDQQNEQ